MVTYSIIQKSQLENAKRFDAEYYQLEYLDAEKKLNSIKTITIEEISESVVNFGAYSLCNYIRWQDIGVPYLNVQDIKDGYINFDDTKFIDEKVNKILKKSQIKEGQVILTMAGTIGNVAVAHNIPKQVNSNQAIAKITLKENFSPYFIVAFLNSYYGRNQIIREIVSSVQSNIFLSQIKNFKVPVVSTEKQKEIEKIYKVGLNELENSRFLYSQAEDIFLKELNIENFQESNILFTITNLSEVQEVNRVDAEYFNSPCNKMLAAINKIKTAKLGDLAEMSKGVEPGAEAYQESPQPPLLRGKLKQFIRVSSISKDGVIDKDQKYLSEELFNKYKKDYQPQAGEILLTKDASPGIACLTREPIEGIVASGVMRLKLPASPKTASRGGKEKINPEYLTLVLNSIVGRLQAERDAGGSIIAHWKPEQIKILTVPILPASTQNKIGDLLSRSYQARKKAKELLEEAKLKVEEMIESKK